MIIENRDLLILGAQDVSHTAGRGFTASKLWKTGVE
jgi:hypothetical protein